jgi:hypothetical protein
MDELIEVAAKTFASRRGPTAPDDDLLYALLCHQPLAVRRSTLDFISEISDGLTDKDRGQLLDVLELLLSSYRNHPGSNRYSAYRPTTPDLVRKMACYSANLVALRATLEPDSGGVSLSRLLRAPDDSLEQWRSTVLLWKVGLDADGLQSMLMAVEITGDPPCIIRSPQEGMVSGELARDAIDVAINRLTNDQEMEDRLRYGYAARSAFSYYDGRSWAVMMASWLIPAIAGIPVQAIVVEPPAGSSDRDITEVARLIFTYFRVPGHQTLPVVDKLIKLVFSMPRVFEIDGLALATAVLEDPDLTSQVPQLKNPQVYGRYAKLVRRPRSHFERQEINFKRLPNQTIAAIQEVLLEVPGTQLGWSDKSSLDDE